MPGRCERLSLKPKEPSLLQAAGTPERCFEKDSYVLPFIGVVSVGLRKKASGATTGAGDIGFVIALISRRVTKRQFHCVLLLLLGNDLLQRKVGIDLICVLQGSQLQE